MCDWDTIKRLQTCYFPGQVDRFQIICEARGMSRKSFHTAALYSINQNNPHLKKTTLQKWTRGERKIKGRNLELMCEFLGINPSAWSLPFSAFENLIKECDLYNKPYSHGIINYMLENQHFAEETKDQIRKLEQYEGDYYLVRKSLGDQSRVLVCPLSISIDKRGICHFGLKEVTISIEGYVYGVDVVLMLNGVGRDISDSKYSFYWSAFLDPYYENEYQVLTGALLERSQSGKRNFSLAATAFVCVPKMDNSDLYNDLANTKAIEPYSELCKNAGKYIAHTSLPQGISHALNSFEPVFADLSHETLEVLGAKSI